MGAPQQAYFLIDAKFRGSNNVEQIVNPAKAQAILATLKARFYLDDVIAFKAVWAGVEYHGFWGTVLPSGFNYDHHKPSRLLEINGPKPGQILRTLNDAGLNTLADASIGSISLVNTGINVPISYLAAFYDDISVIGLRYRLNGAGSWTSQTLAEAIAAKDTGIKTFQIPASTFVYNDTVNIEGLVTNPEGTYYTITSNFLVPRLLIVWYGVATFASQAQAKSAVNVYSENTPINVGSIVSTAANGSGNLSAGYYASVSFWYKIFINGDSKSEIETAGAIGTWPAGDPATPVRFLDVTFTHSAADFDQGCPVITGGNGTSYNCFFDNVDEVYRTTASSGGSFIANAFYWTGETAGNGSLEFFEIASGAITATGNCTDGIFIT